MCKKLIYLVPILLVLSFGISVTNANLLARYTFEDGSGKDIIGGFDAIAFNGDAKIIADPEGGPRGMVLSLDGDGDSVLIPKITETIEFTYAMWIYQEVVKSGLISLVTHTYWSTGSVHWGVNSGRPKIGINGSINPGGDLLGPNPIPKGEWHHLTLVKSDTLLLHYVDGVEVASRYLFRSDSVILGEANISEWHGGRYFHGMMDDFCIYDHALSEAEILDAMQDEIWPFAQRPNPKDGAFHGNTWACLSWIRGVNAVYHDVYFGESFDDVNDGVAGAFRGNQTETSFNVGLPGGPYPDGLVLDTTYYWRIDEVEADGITVHKGDVWSFTISVVEDFETNDFSYFPWRSYGDASWETTRSERHSRFYSARSGTIEDGEITTLEVSLDCVSGDITFYRKVSSESHWDHLIFKIDGVEKGDWSGEEDWSEVSFSVDEGTRTFEWTYSKDSSISEGDDTAWIDDIIFPIGPYPHQP